MTDWLITKAEIQADTERESRACLAGGVTIYMERPNTQTLAVSLKSLADTYRRASQRSRVDDAVYLGATNDNPDVICKLGPHASPGNNGFLGSSSNNMLVDSRASQSVPREAVPSTCAWSPIEGEAFRSSIAAMFVNGHLGHFDRRVGDITRGMCLGFEC